MGAHTRGSPRPSDGRGGGGEGGDSEAGLEHSRVLVLCMSAHAFGSDWAQLEARTFRFRDPLNQERRFIPLRLHDAPIKCGAASAKAASKYTQAPATACALSTPVRRRHRWQERKITRLLPPARSLSAGDCLFHRGGAECGQRETVSRNFQRDVSQSHSRKGKALERPLPKQQ